MHAPAPRRLLRTIRPLGPALLLLALALAGRAQGSAPAHDPAADSAAAHAPGTMPATAPADSDRHGRMSGAGGYQRLMAEADSLVRLRGGVHAENAQLYLAWDAPWGMKRAKQARMPACSDSTTADTLYLSFYPGRSSEHFTGYTAELKFMATGSDTLGAWWHMESKGGENGGNMLVEWGPSPDMPGIQPWRTGGQGFALMDHTRDAMRLRLLFAMTLDDAGPLAADVTYTLCRVILRHRPARHLAGCEKPVCVQWSKATLGFALKDEPEIHRGERLVSYGGPYPLCDPFHEAPIKAWKPKVAGSK